MEGAWYVLRSGCQWRLLPSVYGFWRSVHARFKSWSDRGIWKAVFEFLKNDPDTEYMMIDATVARAHPCAAGYRKNSQRQEGLGRSKGGFTTKIHARVDALGNPLQFIVTPGQTHDITQAEALTQDLEGTTIIADKGYDCDDFIDTLTQNGNQTAIPPRSNRKTPRTYDPYLYKERNLIERFFSKIKQFRRIFSRFDKAVEVSPENWTGS